MYNDEDDDGPQVSQSELDHLRAIKIERDHRRWLWKSIKTLSSVVGAVLTLVLAGLDAVMRIVEWLYRK